MPNAQQVRRIPFRAASAPLSGPREVRTSATEPTCDAVSTARPPASTAPSRPESTSPPRAQMDKGVGQTQWEGKSLAERVRVMVGSLVASYRMQRGLFRAR